MQKHRLRRRHQKRRLLQPRSLQAIRLDHFPALHPRPLPIGIAKQLRLLLAVPQGSVQGVQVSLESVPAGDLRHGVGVGGRRGVEKAASDSSRRGGGGGGTARRRRRRRPKCCDGSGAEFLDLGRHCLHPVDASAAESSDRDRLPRRVVVAVEESTGELDDELVAGPEGAFVGAEEGFSQDADVVTGELDGGKLGLEVSIDELHVDLDLRRGCERVLADMCLRRKVSVNYSAAAATGWVWRVFGDGTRDEAVHLQDAQAVEHRVLPYECRHSIFADDEL